MNQIVQNSSHVTFFNITPSPRDDRDINADTLFEDNISYPSRLNYSKQLQKIRNQGIQGTSLAQAGACMLEWINKKYYGKSDQLSPQFIYNSRTNSDSFVMCGRELMKLLIEVGCSTEKSCPYGKDEIEKQNTEHAIKEAREYRIKRYARVKTIHTLKVVLNIFGPCVITFPVFNHTSYMWKQHMDEYKLGGHAMVIVGYDSKGFILRNSWGKHWEKKGYCIYPYEDWGYHDEVWCVSDQENFEKWKEKPKHIITKSMKYLYKHFIKSKNEGRSSNSIPKPRKKKSSKQKSSANKDIESRTNFLSIFSKFQNDENDENDENVPKTKEYTEEENDVEVIETNSEDN